ncbi:MAG TPA: hypothetical protein ENK50_10260 [Sedimenticola sp.]|nr:hypothetical protein [Sedimenticola sp.]
MDRFTRNYSIILGLAVLLFLGWALYEDPAVSELNDQLEADPLVGNYPYPFRVQSLENGTATLLTPRSAEFPVLRLLGLLYPRLAGRPQDDPDLMAAQAQLVKVQKRAAALVMASPRVKRINWVLDRNWLSQHGVQVGARLVP